MLFDTVLAFDHVKHRILIIANARITPDEDLEALYQFACAKIQFLERELERSLSQPAAVGAAAPEFALQPDPRAVRSGRAHDQGAHRRRRHLPGRAVAAVRGRRHRRSVHRLPRAAPRQPVALHVFHPRWAAWRSSARRRRCWCASRGGAPRRTRSPAPGRAARNDDEDLRLGRGAEAQREGARRARHARRPRAQRPRPGVRLRHRARAAVHGARALLARHAPGVDGRRPARRGPRPARRAGRLLSRPARCRARRRSARCRSSPGSSRPGAASTPARSATSTSPATSTSASRSAPSRSATAAPASRPAPASSPTRTRRRSTRRRKDKARALLQALAMAETGTVMSLLIDNYDSFTYNLAQYLGELGAPPLVRRNDEITLDEIARAAPRAHRHLARAGTARGRGHLGRGDPRASGRRRRCSASASGTRRSASPSAARSSGAATPMHGKTSADRSTTARASSSGVAAPFDAGRYHSLVIADPLPAELEVAARTEDGTIMGVRHRDAAGARRAVPSRVGADRRGPAAAAQLPGAVMFARAHSTSCQRREDLTEDEAAAAMGEIMDGQAAPAQIAGAADRAGDEGRAAGRDRRPRADDAGAGDDSCRAPCRRRCSTPAAPAAIAPHTFNVSTVAALVVAACGVRVAKHGNRSVSSRCGSADVFEALGVNVAAPPAVVERCLDEAGIAFFFAPTFHPSMRHAAPTRQELGVRTAFNLLGPLTNPARRAAAAGRRAAAGADRAGGARAGAARLGARLGRARRRRPRRDLDDRLHEGVRVPRRRGQHVLRAPARRRPAEGGAGAICAAATRRDNAAIARACSPASAARRATSCCSTPARRCFIAGRRRVVARRHRGGRRGDRRGGARARALDTLARSTAAEAARHERRSRTCSARSSPPRGAPSTSRPRARRRCRRSSAAWRRRRRAAIASRRRCAGPRRRASSPSASGARRRAACCAPTTTRPRIARAYAAPARRPSRC